MSEFALFTWSNGAFHLEAEYSDKDAAIVGYDGLHASLVNDKTCARAVIKLVDKQLDVVDGKYLDTITHEVTEKKTIKKEVK